MTATILDFSINGVNASSKYFITAHIPKPFQAGIEQSIIDIPKRNGVIASSQKRKQYILPIKGFIDGATPDDLITNLQNFIAWLHSDVDRELILANQSDRYYNAQYLDDPSILRDGNYSNITLLFTCNDPFAYDTTPTTDSQTITTTGTTYVVANAGHTYAFPVITITFNADQQHVYVANNTIVDDVANRFDVSKAFSSGDVLVVDCKNGTIKLNGVSSPAGFGDGGSELAEWIMLAVGNNELEVGTTDESIDVDVDISFEKVYLY